MSKLLSFLAILCLALSTAYAYDITLEWDCLGTCTTATGFNLYVRQSTDCSNLSLFTKMDVALLGTDRTVAISQLQPGLTYCWYIKAYNAVGESGASNTLIFQVPVEEQAPGNATNLRIK